MNQQRRHRLNKSRSFAFRRRRERRFAARGHAPRIVLRSLDRARAERHHSVTVGARGPQCGVDYTPSNLLILAFFNVSAGLAFVLLIQR